MRVAASNRCMPDAFPWLVVFDLDGTLIDSSLDLCLAVNAALNHVERPPLPYPLIASYIGDGAATLVRRALGQMPELGRAIGDVEQQSLFQRAFVYFLEFYREHKLDNTRLYDGVLPALTAIRARAPQLPLAVLTNKPVRPSEEICVGLGIAPFFFAIYGGNSFATKKPDAAGLLALMVEARLLWQERGLEHATFEPSGVLMVGDSATDVLTARRAGVRSLGCRYGLSPESLDAVPADLSCASPQQWPSRIRHFAESFSPAPA